MSRQRISTPEPAKPINKPEVVVVAKNEDYEKQQAQESEAFEEESELHKQVLLGTEQAAQSISEQAVEPMNTRSMHNSMQNDEALVQAMVAGRSVLDLAIECINTRLGRDDISFSSEPDAVGLPIMLGQQSMGKLICSDQSWAMGDGHDAMIKHGQWLAGWIKLEVQQTELRNAAFTDPLTGAWNRRYFTRYLDAAIVQSREARQPLTVMLFDIDGFKHYNDAYGHAAGDEILIETVKTAQIGHPSFGSRVPSRRRRVRGDLLRTQWPARFREQAARIGLPNRDPIPTPDMLPSFPQTRRRSSRNTHGVGWACFVPMGRAQLGNTA